MLQTTFLHIELSHSGMPSMYICLYGVFCCTASLIAWKADQKHGIWLKIPAARSALVSSVIKVMVIKCGIL